MQPQTSFRPPPLDKSLDIRQIVNYSGLHNCSYPAFIFDNGSTIGSVNWSQFVKAVDRTGQQLLEQVKPIPGRNGAPVVAILANVDYITYAGLIFGAMRGDFIPFPVSPRNTSAAVAHLLTATGCRHMIVNGESSATRELALSACKLLNEGSDSVEHETFLLVAPSFKNLFHDQAHNVVSTSTLPPLETADQDKTSLILHSSGSTSFPKAIHLSYRLVFETGIHTKYGEVDLCGQTLSTHAMPPYHAMGFRLNICAAMFGVTISVFQPQVPPILPSPELVISAVQKTGSSLMYCVPSFLESWASNETSVQILKSLRSVMFGGAPLDPSVGDLLVREGVQITIMFGSTETGPVSLAVMAKLPSEGWQWITTPPHLDLAFIPESDETNVFRLAIKVNEHRKPAVINSIIEGVDAYITDDLVELHPSNPKLWRIHGRTDDQIVHSTGEKTNPVPIESRLQKDPFIVSAVMFGHSRFRPGVIILPTKDCDVDISDRPSINRYCDSIWDTIHRVNQMSPQHSRIYKEMIVIASPGKPFEYTVKGTPRRKAILELYAEDIENGYRIYESVHYDIEAPGSWELSAVTEFVKSVVYGTLGSKFSIEDNIFNNGADSLGAVSIRNSLLKGLRSSKLFPAATLKGIPADFLYQLPSIVTLSAFIFGLTVFARNAELLHGGDFAANLADEVAKEDNRSSTWKMLPITTDVIIELTPSKGEPPLVVIHDVGVPGPSHMLSPLGLSTSALWIVQVTPEAPCNSIMELAAFYRLKIKEKQPEGPYRLAAYSGSTVILLGLVRLFEDNGDQVTQFAMIDHFPTLYLPLFDLNTFDCHSEESWHQVVVNSVHRMCGMRERDEGGFGEAARRGIPAIMDALYGRPSTPMGEEFIKNVRTLIRISVEFLLQDDFWTRDEKSQWSPDLFRRWTSELKAPLTVFVGSKGLADNIPPVNGRRVDDLGAREFFPAVSVVPLEGGHIEILENPQLLTELEGEYRRAV